MEPNNFLATGPCRREGAQRTKAELERTVVTLKKLVEKLQHENKSLRTSVAHSELDLQCNCAHAREENEQARKRIVALENDLELAEKRIAQLEEALAEKSGQEGTGEVTLLREQLHRKCELLLKVKDLLTKAAINEKALRQRVSYYTISN